MPKSSSVYQPVYGRNVSRRAIHKPGSRVDNGKKGQASSTRETELPEQGNVTSSEDELSDDGTDEEDEKSSQMLEILDIASDAPVVKYKGNFYRCRWSDLIGTEMLFSSHSRRSHGLPIEAQGPGYALHTMSTIKLAGHPMRVAERHRAADSDKPPKFSPHSQQERQIQHAFLLKLREIKRKRSETDEVAIIAAHTWGGVRGQRKVHFKDGRGVELGDAQAENGKDTTEKITKTVYDVPVSRKVYASEYMPDTRPAAAQLWKQRLTTPRGPNIGPDGAEPQLSYQDDQDAMPLDPPESQDGGEGRRGGGSIAVDNETPIP